MSLWNLNLKKNPPKKTTHFFLGLNKKNCGFIEHTQLSADVKAIVVTGHFVFQT